jgi:hypothetical protein
MRSLLLIPALLLFLSNIPFIHKMDMKAMAKHVAPAKKNGCCKKQANLNSGCMMSEGKTGSSCKSGKSRAEQPCKPDAAKCAKQDATCISVCCFQCAAPDQLTSKLQFGLAIKDNALAGYLQQNWKDPQLTAPWQPPDGC